MFQPAGVKTLLRIRSSEPSRPATAKTRVIVDEEIPRPLTAPAVTGSASQDVRVAEEAAVAEEEEDEEAENEELLAHVSTSLYQLRHSWVEERRAAATELWQQLRSDKEALQSQELGELEDVETVRAMDARAKDQAANLAAAAEEALSLVDGFRRALGSDASADLEKSFEAAAAAEDRRHLQAEARLDALVSGRLSSQGQAFSAGPADSAAGPGPGFVDEEEALAVALYEEASLELQAARARRLQLEERPKKAPPPLEDLEPFGTAEAVSIGEDQRLLELRREVERLRMRQAWAESEAEAAAGTKCRSAAATSASPCRRRAASSADSAAGSPSSPSSPSHSRPGLSPSGSAAPELAGLGRWVDDLRMLLDESKEMLRTDSPEPRKLPSPSGTRPGGPEAAAGAGPGRPSPKGKHSLAAVLGGASPSRRQSGLSGLSPPAALWTTSSAPGEAEAAAGRSPNGAALRPKMEDHLDDLLQELDEIDRIHCKIKNLSRP